MRLTLRRLRENKGWKLKYAAKQYQIDVDRLRDIEHCSVLPTIEEITVILKKLDFYYDEILTIITDELNNKYNKININYENKLKKEKSMENNKAISNKIIDLDNNLAFINNAKTKMFLCSANNTKINIPFLLEDILKIEEIRQKVMDRIRNNKNIKYNEIKVNEVIVDIGSEWLLFMNHKNLICMNLEMFQKLVKSVELLIAN